MTTNNPLIEEAVQAAIDGGFAENGEHGVAAARVAARFIFDKLVELGAERAAPVKAEDLDHSCSDEGRKIRARYVLLLIEQNGVRDNDAMEFLAAVVSEAGASYARERLEGGVPF